MGDVLAIGTGIVRVDQLRVGGPHASAMGMLVGEKGDAFFIIVSGSVRLTRRDPAATDAFILIKDKLLPGAYFGEMALLQPEGRRMATVTANEATVVMSRDREKFQELF